MRLHKGSWTVAALQRDGPRMLGAVPAGVGSAYVLFAAGLKRWNAESGRWSWVRQAGAGDIGEFRSMAPGFDGDLLISAQHGVARFSSHSWMETSSRAIGVEDL
ncbi:MAG: hypothetical protein HY820_26480 [Acidobacteria bacterium]|nr:hypothetical protein [Acidobacteriota bacterium]